MSTETGWERFAELSPEEFKEEIEEVLDGMLDLLSRKRQSYGPHNLTKFGDTGVLVRASDKMERLVHMYQNGMHTTAVGEDAEDAWTDLCGYSLLVLLAHSLEASE